MIFTRLGRRVAARHRRGRRSLDHNPDRDTHRFLDSHSGRRSGFGCPAVALDRLLAGRRLRSVAYSRGVFPCVGGRLCPRDLVVRNRRLLAHGQKRLGIDVAVRVGGDANAEVYVCGRAVGRRRRDRSHLLSLAHRGALRDRDRAQPDQRDRVAVGRLNRDRGPVVRHLARERDRARRWCEHVRAGFSGHIDAPVLAAGVGIVAEREGADDLSARRPAPAQRRSGQDQCNQSRHKGEQGRTSHPRPLSVVRSENRASIAGRQTVVNTGYSERP